MKPILHKISADTLIKLTRHLENIYRILSPPKLYRQSNIISLSNSSTNTPVESRNNSPRVNTTNSINISILEK